MTNWQKREAMEEAKHCYYYRVKLDGFVNLKIYARDEEQADKEVDGAIEVILDDLNGAPFDDCVKSDFDCSYVEPY